MKTIKLMSVNRTFRIPETAYEWELYTTVGGSDTAAEKLTTALATIIQVLDVQASEGFTPTRKAIGKMMATSMEPLFDEYANQGASDTEPRYNAEHALLSAVRIMLSVSL